MPTYEYRCPNCGKFEAVQRITDKPLKACPTCGSDIDRLISHNVGIVFKGSGWYCTDNRKSSTSEPSKSFSADSSSSSESSASDTSSSSSGEKKVS